MEIKLKQEEAKDRLVKNVPSTTWARLKTLAHINQVSIAKMIELLLEQVEKKNG